MTFVADASVILAHILGEPGGDRLERDGPFTVSAVNYAEVLSRVADRGGEERDVERLARRLGIEVVGLEREDALLAGQLRRATRSLGLSLGDRFCLALGQRLLTPVLTADRKWAELDICIDIRLIR